MGRSRRRDWHRSPAFSGCVRNDRRKPERLPPCDEGIEEPVFTLPSVSEEAMAPLWSDRNVRRQLAGRFVSKAARRATLERGQHEYQEAQRLGAIRGPHRAALAGPDNEDDGPDEDLVSAHRWLNRPPVEAPDPRPAMPVHPNCRSGLAFFLPLPFHG